MASGMRSEIDGENDPFPCDLAGAGKASAGNTQPFQRDLSTTERLGMMYAANCTVNIWHFSLTYTPKSSATKPNNYGLRSICLSTLQSTVLAFLCGHEGARETTSSQRATRKAVLWMSYVRSVVLYFDIRNFSFGFPKILNGCFNCCSELPRLLISFFFPKSIPKYFNN